MWEWIIVCITAVMGAWLLKQIDRLDDKRRFVAVEKGGKTYNIERELYDVYGTSIIDEYRR